MGRGTKIFTPERARSDLEASSKDMKAKVTTPSYILQACPGLLPVPGHAFAEEVFGQICITVFSYLQGNKGIR
jgi:hypothetical protein